jgi:hypothetical protein
MSINGKPDQFAATQALDNLQVINRHTYEGPRDQSYLYIGRGTPLGNNWSHVTGTAATFKVATRQDAVAEYRRWLRSEIQSGKGPALQALQNIKERVTQGEKVKLALLNTPSNVKKIHHARNNNHNIKDPILFPQPNPKTAN